MSLITHSCLWNITTTTFLQPCFLGGPKSIIPWQRRNLPTLKVFWEGVRHTTRLLPPSAHTFIVLIGEIVVTGCVVVRGRATERQDHHLPLVQRVAEESEELRLTLCRMVGRMLVTLMDRGTIGVLRPYLDDTILLLVSQCRDTYSTVTVEALSIITKLVLHPHLEQVRRCVQNK